MSTKVRTPKIQWAQREENILVNVDVQDTTNIKVEFGNELSFNCDTPTGPVAFKCELYKEI